MCGLSGILSPNPVPDLPAVIAGMNQALHHRGPDQTGLYIHPSGKLALGHKRLSVIDLTHGRQPMTDADGLFTLVFNGEIYNHGELKAELVGRGHPIASRSDTETLLYAFKEWGAGCLPRLRGMFAFAVYDHREGSVFLARDRLGIKPMYYGFSGGAALFASECKAILEYPGFPRALDPQAVSDYFSFLYVPAPKSIFADIRKLPAGHWLKILPGGQTQLSSWWDLEFPESTEYGTDKGIAQGAEELLACLDESVQSHMESDVPLGAFLSGGVDSAAVVALMARHSSRRVITNTIGFREKSHDERRPAAETAAILKTDHREFEVEPKAVEVLDKLAWFYDEPFADSSMIPTYYVCGMARQNVTVALSGDGGDENFAGYRRYYFDSLENRVRARLPAALRVPLFRLAGTLYPKADWLPRTLRAKSTLLNLSYPPLKAYFTSLTHFKPATKARLFSQGLKRALGGYDSLSVFEDHWRRCSSADPLARVQYLDFKTYLVDDILTKVDRASMAHALEVRVPVLDHRVVELAARMPSAWKLQGREGKHIFKRCLKGVVPDPVFRRPKSGFSIPIDAWFRKDLREFAQESLFGDSGKGMAEWLDMGGVGRMWKEHQSGVRDHGVPLFAILYFSVWKDRFLKRS